MHWPVVVLQGIKEHWWILRGEHHKRNPFVWKLEKPSKYKWNLTMSCRYLPSRLKESLQHHARLSSFQSCGYRENGCRIADTQLLSTADSMIQLVETSFAPLPRRNHCCHTGPTWLTARLSQEIEWTLTLIVCQPGSRSTQNLIKWIRMECYIISLEEKMN